VHRITAEHLHGRPLFADRLGEVTRWLTGPEGREHVLVGHVVQFDAERLHHEYQVAGMELPPLRLLDTRRLAEVVGLVGASSLGAPCAALGVSRVGAHTASGDAHTTAAAAHQLLSRLAAAPEWTPEQLPTLLDDLIEPFVPRKLRRRARREPEELTAEHLAAHTADLTQAASRRQALEVCLAERCSMLAFRMEDGITSRSRARWVVEWALEHLESGRLDRRLTGRMLAGLGVALRRCEAPAFAEQVLMDQQLPLLQEWGPCATDRRYTTRRCGRCLHAAGVCRFVVVARDAADAVLFAASAPTRQLDRTGVGRFLPGFSPGSARRGRPPEGLFQRLRRAGQVDAAGHGAARVAEYRRDHGDRAWALALLRKARADGCRTPRLAEMLASMTVLDATDRARRNRHHIRDAIDVLDEALQQPARARALPNATPSAAQLAHRPSRHPGTPDGREPAQPTATIAVTTGDASDHQPAGALAWSKVATP